MRNWFKKNKIFSFILATALSVFLLLIFLCDFSTILTVNETKRGYEELESTVQNHLHIIDNRIEQYFLVLEKDALLLEEEELTLERNQELLQKIKELPEIQFDSLGITDETGRAVLSTGEYAFVKNKEYYKAAMSGDNYIFVENQDEKTIAVVSVPIFDNQGMVKGVLFGKEPLEDMGLFDHILIEEERGHIQLLDQDDNCVWNILGKKRIGQIIVTYPVSNSDLYLYEGTDKEYINQTVRYYQKDMLYLTIKLVCLCAAMIGLYISHTLKERKRIEALYKKLSISEEVYRVTAEHSNQCIFTYDLLTNQIEFLNDKYKEFGFSSRCLDVSTLLKDFEKESVANYHKLSHLVASVKHHVPEMEKEILVKINGENRCLKVLVVNLFDEKQLFLRSLGMIEDITEQKENAMMMKREQNFRKSLLADCLGYVELNVNEDMVLENSFQGEIQENVKGSFTKLIEFYVDKKVLPEYQTEVLRQMSRQTIKDNFKKGIYECVVEYQTKESDGTICWTACDIRTKQEEDRKELIAYLVYRNIDAKKKEQLRLQEEASLDALTKALKRKAAAEMINRILQKPLAEGYCHVFMLLDMDNFKKLNDTLGHITGDQALIDLVKTAKQNCRVSDLVCRLGGDEFIVFLPDVAKENVAGKAEVLLKALRFSYEKDGNKVSTSVSIGVSLAPNQGVSFNDLYAAADKALYRAKTSQKGTYCIFE